MESENNKDPNKTEEGWLSKPPKFTTFRINLVKHLQYECLVELFQSQSKELFGINEPQAQAPKFYLLRPDCLVIERWPEDPIFSPTANEVIVDALCAAAVLRGAHVFAPGVLGLPASCRIGERIDIYGDLDGQCKRGYKVKYNGKKLYVGTGYLKMSRHDLFDNGIQPSGIAVHTLMPASKLPVINESLYPKGTLLLQNLPSMVCGWVVNAQPGEYILDMCAAPGNKTTHLGQMSNNLAFISAIDKTLQKVEKIRENCETQCVTCVNAYVYDSTKCCSEDSSGVNMGPPFPPNSFDKVLLDAPCSGLGQRPQLVNKMSPKMLQSYKFVQRKLFDSAVKVLKVGGKLVYSTCTVTIDENEGMVAWALVKYPCLKLLPAEPLLGGPGQAGCGLTDEQRALVQRFGPKDDPLRHVDSIYKDTIGFFIASFTKLS